MFRTNTSRHNIQVNVREGFLAVLLLYKDLAALHTKRGIYSCGNVSDVMSSKFAVNVPDAMGLKFAVN